MTALYAQLESLTTGVAQLRRDAPRKAAKEYAAQLAQVIKEEEEMTDEGEEREEGAKNDQNGDGSGSGPSTEDDAMDVEADSAKTGKHPRRRGLPRPEWNLKVQLGTDEETERWMSGDMADVYEDALRTLQRLQGEDDGDDEPGTEGNALASTVGKAERAGRAAEVVEKM